MIEKIFYFVLVLPYIFIAPVFASEIHSYSQDLIVKIKTKIESDSEYGAKYFFFSVKTLLS